MNVQKLLQTVALAAALVAPGLALADGGRRDHDGRFGKYDREHRREDRREERREHRREHRRAHRAHVHSHACRHSARPPPVPAYVRHDSGRYEVQVVSRWVEGRYESVWVPEQCRYKKRGRVKVCRAGFYDRQWVPGHYVETEEWVWVPHPPSHYHGRRAGFDVRIRL